MIPDKDLTDDVLDEIIAGAKTSMEQYLALSLKAERAAGNSPVIPDGYRLQPISEYEAMCATVNSDEWPQRWIPVSERMPEAGDDMIVFTDGIVMSGISYTKKKGFYIQALEYDDDEPVDSVTHWMPLPAAPQEVSNEK